MFKKKMTSKKIKASALTQKEIEKIMKNEKYSGEPFEGLTNKEIKSQERTLQNPVFEITNHKVSGFMVSPKKKTCAVMYNDAKVGTVKKEYIPHDMLNGEVNGYISGGKRKYLDLNDEGGLKFYTKKSYYVLYLQ
ncbi:hypothetical protein [Alkalibacterium sp. 20]|uniref:hypothetical protein n=1 Tax=Alkalibacterium sp. 20 TaxID=1798803 RepID=UPI000900451B|nr:hypothetical protein [Alkalibacterium sp. 20]OJF91402.1 hypothetical protein AX762_11040 [Alkalibacterium sp. 20]